MREGANRVIGIALLASLALHAALFALVPQYRELSALIPPQPEPLVARIERLAPPPAPAQEMPKPKPAARRVEPVAEPAPAPQPVPEPPAPHFEPQPAPEPAPAPVQAPPPAPLVRVDPRLLLEGPAEADARRARALARYGDEMNRAAKRFERYPRAAVDNNWHGEVAVALSVNAQGGIADLRITSSTGYPLLDRLALEMFREAHAVVSIPGPLRGRPFEKDLRAIYEIRN